MLTASARRPVLLDAWLARWGILDWLRLFWCAAVLWYEVASYVWSLRWCSWPDSGLSPARERPAHLLLVADPQVRDLSTSKATGIAAARQYLLDLTLKRHWYFASRRSPDVVVFLGDILASWRSIKTDEEYERSYNKFLDVFRLDRRIPSYFVPGNNDVGVNIDSTSARRARQRFTSHFGPLNQHVSVRNHTLVMLDAAGLVEEDYQRSAKYVDYDHWTPLPRGAVEFVHSLKEEADQAHPAILFTHIPLHRPDTASCGPLRERGTIRRGVGPSYQNTLGKKTTTFVLKSVTPEIVFSADDKDYCDYVHVPPRSSVLTDATSPNATTVAKPRNVREITVKTFSPTSEIRHPGFQLLSVTYPSSEGSPSLATTPCFFPDYPSAYLWRYLPLLFLTILTLIFLRRRKLRSPPLPTHLTESGLRKSFSLNSLPTAPWSPKPHPATPFSPDWSPYTPGLSAPHPRSPDDSPQESFPTDSLRAPISRSASHASVIALGGDAQHLRLPSTPTFRATAIPRTDDDGLPQHLPMGPAHLDVDELDDEFAYARYDQRQPLRVKLERGDADGGPADTDEFAFTFTLYGRRRRISLWIPLLSRSGRATFSGRRRGKWAFAKRVAKDLVYTMWPAVLLWAVLAWLVS
ncbi:hypothetical protein K466DRAFT_657614 [Polyporus arcularius HHB13444]|uniref:Calcineurin-like phosphoesterase domain-containing protein n=1 Tax=Polyporus arcularius HHB13444 TaxID=1314778 RepID=A0A5C3PYG1_9APHY|nr:hypothetical protein K466DRAFT_657614 [Polyporus arcularius HHB13444]